MYEWQQHAILSRQDGSYVIIRAGLPCHVPNMGEWAELHAAVAAFVEDNPEQAQPEPLGPEELAGWRIAVAKQRLATLDAQSIRPLRAFAGGTASQEDQQRLADINAEIDGLRADLQTLAPGPEDAASA